MSMVRWFQETPPVSLLGYYYLQEAPAFDGAYGTSDYTESRYKATSSGEYYEYKLDAYAVIKRINKYTTSEQKKAGISERDKGTRQHALHYVLSHNLYDESHEKEFTLSKKDINKVIVVENGYLGMDIRTRSSIYSSFDERHAVCVQTSEYKELEHELKNLRNNYNELKEGGRLLSTQERTRINKEYVIQALISPFDDQSLVNQLLLVHDKNGNTPLFYAYKVMTSQCSKDDFRTLLIRIRKLSEEQRKQLLAVQNENGKTILHNIVTYWKDLGIEKDAFGAHLIKQAMCLSDRDGNTPLHAVFCNSKPLSMVQSMGTIFLEVEEKHPNVSLNKIFGRNNNGLNPLHLLCQRNSSKEGESLQILDELLKIMPEKFCNEKFMEKDHNGCTPLHYAIESGNNALVTRILKLSGLELKRLVEMEDKHHETTLHYACRFGNDETLQQIVKIMGPKKFYEIRCQSNLSQLRHRNNNLSESDLQTEIENHNTLFNCYDYFVKNYSNKNNNYKHRMDDFCECLSSMARELKPDDQPVSLPEPAFNFHGEGHFFGIFKSRNRYQHLRGELQHVEYQELIEFKTFLTEQNNQGSSSYKVATKFHEKLANIQVSVSELHENVSEQRKAASYSPRLLAPALSPMASDRPPSYEEAIAPKEEKLSR